MAVLIFVSTDFYTVISWIMSVVSFLIGGWLIAKGLKTKVRSFSFFGSGLIFNGLSIIIQPFYVLNKAPDIIGGISWIIAFTCILYGTDLFRSEALSKFSFAGFFFFIGAFIGLVPNFEDLNVIGPFLDVLISLMAVVRFIPLMLQIHRNAFGNLKHMVRTVIIISCIALVIYIQSEAQLIIFFDGLNEISDTIIWAPLFILILRHEQLAKLLPYRVYRLLILDNKSGICIYNYEFYPFELQEDMVCAVLQGLQQMSFEFFKQGSMEQIEFEHGFLIFKKTELVTACVLITRPSKYIRTCLSAFLTEFEARFDANLHNNMGDLSVYAGASDITKRTFYLIPQMSREEIVKVGE